MDMKSALNGRYKDWNQYCVVQSYMPTLSGSGVRCRLSYTRATNALQLYNKMDMKYNDWNQYCVVQNYMPCLHYLGQGLVGVLKYKPGHLLHSNYTIKRT